MPCVATKQNLELYSFPSGSLSSCNRLFAKMAETVPSTTVCTALLKCDFATLFIERVYFPTPSCLCDLIWPKGHYKMRHEQRLEKLIVYEEVPLLFMTDGNPWYEWAWGAGLLNRSPWTTLPGDHQTHASGYSKPSSPRQATRCLKPHAWSQERPAKDTAHWTQPQLLSLRTVHK